MTASKGFKRKVRARASKTGESYTAALQHIRITPPAAEQISAPGHGQEAAGRIDPNFLDALAAERIPTPQPIRIAVAQVDPPADPRDRGALRRRSYYPLAHGPGPRTRRSADSLRRRRDLCTG